MNSWRRPGARGIALATASISAVESSAAISLHSSSGSGWYRNAWELWRSRRAPEERGRRHDTPRWPAPWLATVGLFAVWEAACRLFAVPEFVLPAPSQAVAALIEYWPAIWQNAFYTFWVTLLGFAIAVAFGLALGIVTGASALVYSAIYPLLVGFNSIPRVAIVSVLVEWFGVGMYALFAVIERRVVGWAFRGAQGG